MKTSFNKNFLLGTSALISAKGPIGNIPDSIGFGICSAFADTDFDPQGNGTKGNMKIATYDTTADTLATVEAADYFSNEFVATTMRTGDLIVVNASDGIRIYELTVTLSTTTVTLKGVMDDFFILNAEIINISSAGQIYVVSPFAGTVFAVYTVLNGAITSADAVLTVKTAAGTVGTITVANSGSAAGVVDSLLSGLVNTAVAKGATVEIETDGGSTGVIPVVITVLMRRT